MIKRERVLDDIARLAGGTVGVASDIKRHIDEIVRSVIDSKAQDLDLVPRDDFEKLELMVIEAREKQRALEERISILESKK
ncbi:MAG: accessory factor UbiK family protein [Alphaproteobacteria bacterium]